MQDTLAATTVANTFLLPTPGEFAAAVEVQWKRYSNVTSEPLREAWRLLGATFNASVLDSLAPETAPRAVQMPTGSGKSVGVAVYGSLLLKLNAESDSPVGMLIATRTRDQVNEVAAHIRALSSSLPFPASVIGHHSERRATPDEMRSAAVLVVTHENYLRTAREDMGGEIVPGSRADQFLRWENGTRRLVVIDETLGGIIEDFEICATDLRQAVSLFDTETRDRFSREIANLESLLGVLEDLERPFSKTSTHFLWKHGATYRDLPFDPSAFDMGGLRNASVHFSLGGPRHDNTEGRQSIRENADKVLAAAETILPTYAYFYRHGEYSGVHSAKLNLREGLPAPVFLDATAKQHYLWKLLGQRVEIVEAPQGVRDYSRVKIHVTRVPSGCGMGSWLDKDKRSSRATRLIAEMKREVPAESKVLVCIHKDYKDALVFQHPFSAYDLAHWGKIDGFNTWSTFDTIVIPSLLYPNPASVMNAYFVTNGLPADDWFDDKATEIKNTITQQVITVSLVQAINRLRCRKVIDEQGRCDECNVYLVLRPGEEGDTILDNIRDEMPGVQVLDWPFSLDGKGAAIKRGSADARLLSAMNDREPGEHDYIGLMNSLGIGSHARKKLLGRIRDEASPIYSKLAEIGIGAETRRVGRSTRTILVKLPSAA